MYMVKMVRARLQRSGPGGPIAQTDGGASRAAVLNAKLQLNPAGYFIAFVTHSTVTFLL